MGNIEAHDFAPVRADERKLLNLSRKVTPKQYVRHLNGQCHEACLTELPWNIRDSVSLYERMTASFNALTEIPVELPLRLPHLSDLDLSHNQLASLPESFGLLFHLKEIHLQHNRMSSLPESFVHLVKLEKIDLSYNELRTLPEDIGCMERLGRLNITHNKLKELPLTLGQPSCPVYVLLAHQNRLEKPPQAVCEEGSASTLGYLRKLFSSSTEAIPTGRTVLKLNHFPRQCANRPSSEVNNPHSAQVKYIQEQTHTAHTTNRIKAPLLPPVDATTLGPFQLRDKVIGLLYGAAIGDAIGLACRWMTDDECSFHYGSDRELVYERIAQDEHRVLWRQGDWTSNFDQMMLVLESLVNWGGVVDELEFARRLRAWEQHGFRELGDSVGVVTSNTIRKVVSHPSFCQDPHSVAHTTLLENREENVSPGSLSNKSSSPTCSNSHIPFFPSEKNPSAASDSPFPSQSPPSVSKSSNDHSPPPTIIISPPHAYSQHSPILRLSSSSSSLSSLSLCNHVEVTHKLVHSAAYETFGVDNGAVVRSAVLGVPNFHNVSEVVGNAVRICKTTHSDPKCVASCVLVSLMISLMLQGQLVMTDEDGRQLCLEQLDTVFEQAALHLDSPTDKEEFMALKACIHMDNFDSRESLRMSHTYKPVQAAIVALHWSGDYKSCISALTKLAGDSNSNCCVAGAILGCCLGYSHLPQDWLQDLRKRQVTWLNSHINHLLDVMGLP